MKKRGGGSEEGVEGGDEDEGGGEVDGEWEEPSEEEYECSSSLLVCLGNEAQVRASRTFRRWLSFLGFSSMTRSVIAGLSPFSVDFLLILVMMLVRARVIS